MVLVMYTGSSYYTRYRALDGDMSRYLCCQGYINCLCFRGGALGKLKTYKYYFNCSYVNIIMQVNHHVQNFV
jgi:hypothetical protein